MRQAQLLHSRGAGSHCAGVLPYYNARQALTIAQGRPGAHSCSAAQASIRMKGLRAQHL